MQWDKVKGIQKDENRTIRKLSDLVFTRTTEVTISEARQDMSAIRLALLQNDFTA
jgi:hypothetical protein